MESETLIQFKNVSMSFEVQDGIVQVLKGVNFGIRKNSFLIIYGPSGSGKSTILNILLGLLVPSAGTVEVMGKDFYALNQNERALFRGTNYGMVSQMQSWVNSLNVVENVALPLYLKGESMLKAKKKAQESLDRVGLGDYATYNPAVLSTGQQQRISMARATIEAPMFLIADEPTGNLDTKSGDMIMSLLTWFKNHQNSTVILVTHNLEYLSLSDHRLFIKDGILSQDEGGFSVADNRMNLKAGVNPGGLAPTVQLR